ncbi:MAG: hypothetical protein Fur0041_18410 [Bacteroidia bacterium]
MLNQQTLAYMACGTQKMNLNALPYRHCFLSDRSFKNSYQKNNFICLAGDAIKALKYLRNKDQKLDCFISINEGLLEGGGDYPLNGEFFLALLSPVLNDIYLHIYSPEYYRWTPFRHMFLY